MHNYELIIILRNKEIDSLKEKVKDILNKYKVNITSDEPWGLRKLAYSIDRETNAYYFYYNIEASPDTIKKMKNDFNLNSDVLRYLFIRIESKKTA